MAPTKKTTTVAKKASSHPPFLAMIQEAVKAHPDDVRKGVSRPTIKKFIEDTYKLDMSSASHTTNLSSAIKRGVESKHLALPGGPSGRVKLAPKVASEKPDTKPVEKKTVTKAKPVAAKTATKVAVPKKTSSKTAAKPVKATKPAAAKVAPAKKPITKKALPAKAKPTTKKASLTKKKAPATKAASAKKVAPKKNIKKA
ncbi:hypothetical protein L204_100095 [Cryptococcus depauperatus]|nr:hypothetical protein L204_02424 [Cryptococcus depauperatus CBS 7855]